jgi:cardiolipin synthase
MDVGSVSFLLFVFDIVLVFFVSLWVLRTSEVRTPGQSLSWILVFLVFPVAGVLLYLALGYRGFRRRRRYRRAKKSPNSVSPVAVRSPLDDAPFSGSVALANSLSGIPASQASSIEVQANAYQSYGSLAEAIRAAKSTIHLEYYIFQPDETGLKFRDLLVEKAREGVKCKLLVDAVGSHRLSKRFYRPLREAGVEFATFAPVQLGRLWSFHYRNHRKLAVVDSQIGFVGSQNIGNEYLGWKNRGRSWNDIQIRLQGDVVHALNQLFIDDWGLATGINQHRPIGAPHSANPHSLKSVSILPTGPDEREHSLEMLLCDLIVRARRSILVATPYFVPSLPIRMALQSAARRGVEVLLLTPERSDQWLVDRAGRIFLRELSSVGVKTYLHSAGFLHAKVIVVDSDIALIGSANMDERSFRLNWELSILIAEASVVKSLEASLDSMLKNAARVSWSEQERSGVAAVGDGIIRLMTPLL